MGWKPEISFDEMVRRMVQRDVPGNLCKPSALLEGSEKKVVLVTGGSGLVGQGVKAVLEGTDLVNGKPSSAANYFRQRPGETWVFASSKDANLTDLEATRRLFIEHQPTHCLHLAAVVGGLFRNMRQPLDFFRDNMAINMNVLACCHEFGVTKAVSCLSTCIFPDKVTYPIGEGQLHNGAPHPSNAGYAHAKRMIDVLNRSYSKQHGRCFTAVVPTNIYGPSDNFNLEDAHVIPALIHKCYLAKQAGAAEFTVFGSGKPLRQFIHSYDLGRLMVWAVREYTDVDEPVILSVDPEMEVSIGDVARLIAEAVGFEGKLVFDTSKADGQLKKTADNAKLKKLLAQTASDGEQGGVLFDFMDMRSGIQNAVQWFVSNFESARK